MAAPPDAPVPAPQRAPILGALAIVLIASLSAIGLSLLDRITAARIQPNAQEWIRVRLNALVPPSLYNNDLLADTVTAHSPDLLGTSRPVTVYRARKGLKPVAAVLHTVAPDGYRGPIELLVAIAPDGKLIGVQVVRHRETPGLGDAFENRDADWLSKFTGRSLQDPPQQRWAVRPDGGEFDAFTGATITPRAIVKSVRRALEFYRAKQKTLFTAPNGTEIR
jgi:electron transport complex protein RnfG